MYKLNVIAILKQQNKSKYWLFNKINAIKPMSYTNFNNLIENKTNSIKYDNLSLLCKVLNCTPNDLFKDA